MNSGCAHELSFITDPVEVMNRRWESELGGTSAHIYRTRHPNSRNGYAVVKIPCMPFSKSEQASAPPFCSEEDNEVRV